MSAVFFKPWIGDNYGSSSMFGKKILVLGESHYQWDVNIHLKPELTRDCIIEQITTNYKKQFWTNIAVAFLSKNPNQKEKKDFWHSVSFYNYIQANVGFGPRVRPSAEMWRQSEPGFIEVMSDLTPDVLIVLGYALWNNLPALHGEDGPLIMGAEQPNTWLYPLVSGGTCLAYGVRHPSAGFSGRYWHHHIKQAISVSSVFSMNKSKHEEEGLFRPS